MKRLICTVIVCVLILGACAVIQPVKNPYDDVYIINPNTRLTATENPEITGIDTLSVTLARNESEGLQLVLRPKRGSYSNVRISATSATSENGITLSADSVELFHVEYTHSIVSEDDTWELLDERKGDSSFLIPLTDENLDCANYNTNSVICGENLIYYIKITTDADTPAETYKGTVTLTYDGGEKAVPLIINVVDITLPATPSLRSDFLYWGSFTPKVYTGISDADYRIFSQKIADMCRKNKINCTNAIDIPGYGNNPEKYAQSMKEFLEAHPTITTFTVPFFFSDSENCILDTDRCKPIYDALREAGIIDKAILSVSTFDEPHDEATFKQINNVGLWLNEYAPDLRHYVTTFPGNLADMSIVKAEAIDIWCGVYNIFKLDTLEEYQAKGYEFWGYGFDKSTRLSLDRIKTIGWELKKHNILGIEDWCVNSWYSTYDPDRGGWVIDDNIYPGERWSFIYCGKVGDDLVNADIPIATLSLESIRDAIEDYDYLLLLEKRVKEKIAELGISVTVDEAMESYYDALFMDIHRVSTDNEDTYSAMKERITKEIINGVEFIMTTEADELSSNDTLIFTIYTEVGKAVTVDERETTARDFEKYRRSVLFYSVTEASADYTIFVDGTGTYSHILGNSFDYLPVFDLTQPGLIEEIRKANPGATVEIVIDKGDIDYGRHALKIVFDENTKKGIEIPVSLLKNKMTGYKSIRCSVWTDSDTNTLLPSLCITADAGAVSSNELKTAPTTDSSVTYLFEFKNSLIGAAADGMQYLKIRYNGRYKEPVTFYFADMYYIK